MAISDFTEIMAWQPSKVWEQDFSDKVRKEFVNTVGELGLKITIQTNMKIVNYSEGNTESTKREMLPLIRMPENVPLYVNAKCNHPPPIIKQLPAAISRRISTLSYDD